MKIQMTAELWALAEEALQEARCGDGERDEFDGHAWAHRAAEKVSEHLVDQQMPSRSDIRESIGGALVSAWISASRRRPRLANTLLRNCEIQEVIPDELIELPAKKLVPRGQLYAHEQAWLAARGRASVKAENEKARYDEALSIPFTDWQARELSIGRPRSQLTQMTFWMECGYVAMREAAE